eukprot:6477000-Amphidinium_carterae.1
MKAGHANWASSIRLWQVVMLSSSRCLPAPPSTTQTSIKQCMLVTLEFTPSEEVLTLLPTSLRWRPIQPIGPRPCPRPRAPFQVSSLSGGSVATQHFGPSLPPRGAASKHGS